MQYQLSLREVNQQLPKVIKLAEEGHEIIVTRRGKPVAHIKGLPKQKILSTEQKQARSRVLAMMNVGFSLGGQKKC